ncbi:MAG: phosphatidylserine decarboxylase [Chloroflexales bacterium]|jgi:phosphatidylserine decarboxylase
MEPQTPAPTPEQTTAKDRVSRIPGFDAEATPLLSIGIGLTGIVLGLRPRLAPLPLALTALTAALYRDPDRTTPLDPNGLFAAADGAVLLIDEIYDHRFMHTDCMRIVTAVSPLDVPVCRSPASGTVRYVAHVSGEYRSANDSQAAERNERVYVGIDTAWGPILVIQIASPIGRRIVCKTQVGDVVEAGTRLGTVRLGCRTDLLIQRDAAHLLISTGQHLVAGVSRIGAVMPPS